MKDRKKYRIEDKLECTILNFKQYTYVFEWPQYVLYFYIALIISLLVSLFYSYLTITFVIFSLKFQIQFDSFFIINSESKFLITNYELGGSLDMSLEGDCHEVEVTPYFGIVSQFWYELGGSFIHNFTTISYLIWRWPKIPRRNFPPN
jgi:hypothetical protein